MNDANWQLYLQHRDRRADELEASIHQPGAELAILVLDSSDREPLAMAIERCEPEEVARWLIELAGAPSKLLDDAVPFNDEDSGDWRADESEARP